ncbi:putative secreted acid phosphatase [Anoxybacillus tepidamans]|uniref:Putative secreted acid phosphatase n=1 Tax=Anoxybacteroides tepidamans TaxID=265948 RepID=A0A7W8ISL6_9BACL|nr:putative secreted acid phosphatase [Anoxybacillus tepidamans]
MGDFAKEFDQKNGNNVGRLHEQFGRKFIVLPNPMYGDWEGAIFVVES